MRVVDHESVTVHGDHSHCNICGQSWDTNDLYPPLCRMAYRASKRPKRKSAPAFIYFSSGVVAAIGYATIQVHNVIFGIILLGISALAWLAGKDIEKP